MTTKQIQQELADLSTAGFLQGWMYIDRQWTINPGAGMYAWGPYTKKQVMAFLDGCHAMGGW